MSNPTSPEEITGQGQVPVILSVKDIADILPHLPGGQSVSPAMRRLYQELLDAQRRGVRLLPAVHVPDTVEDIFYAPPVLTRQPPSEQPRRALILCKRDTTGATGVGVIAEGCQFSDGSLAWRRLDEPGWQFFDRPGADSFARTNPALVTEVVWIDEPDEPA